MWGQRNKIVVLVVLLTSLCLVALAKTHYQLRIVSDCIDGVEKLPDTECVGLDLKHLDCRPLLLHIKRGCVQLDVREK